MSLITQNSGASRLDMSHFALLDRQVRKEVKIVLK